MKKAIVYFTLVLLSNLSFYAQSWDWAKDMGSGSGGDITSDALGNIYLIAGTNNTYGGSALIGAGAIAKHDSLGNVIWVRGTQGSLETICLDKVGNVYVTGSFGGSMTVSGGG